MRRRSGQVAGAPPLTQFAVLVVALLGTLVRIDYGARQQLLPGLAGMNVAGELFRWVRGGIEQPRMAAVAAGRRRRRLEGRKSVSDYAAGRQRVLGDDGVERLDHACEDRVVVGGCPDLRGIWGRNSEPKCTGLAEER